jgi:hypothetical protein
VRALEGFELAVKGVVVGVADLGASLDVVEAVVTADFGAELFESLLRHKKESGVRG